MAAQATLGDYLLLLGTILFTTWQASQTKERMEHEARMARIAAHQAARQAARQRY